MKDPNDNTDPNQDLYDMNFQRIILVDFDGVLHRYSQGWKGPTNIYDPPTAGAIEWLQRLLAHEAEDGTSLFDVQIYSSRSKDPNGPDAMRAWFKRYLTMDQVDKLKFPTEKPAAWITIDDRAFQFRGFFPQPEFLSNFRGWTQNPRLIREAAGEEPSDALFLAGVAGKFSGEERARILRIAYELDGVHQEGSDE